MVDQPGWSVSERPSVPGQGQHIIVVHPYAEDGRVGPQSIRSPDARLNEAVGLAEAIGLFVSHKETIRLKSIRPATFIGPGKATDIADLAKAHSIDLVIFDCQLSPIQQRNLEKAIGAKVIDRTALILEIFGERARTREGEIQVELAHLEYQKSRLVRSWTHLERQRGGFGFMGGPGERQIESDRRIISERITLLKKQLEKVRKTRGLHRKNRQNAPYPVIALVGYTNAGKSTLFNQLTQSDVLAEDMLFATLDPTMRAISLPSGRKVILSDTVGFISDLPTTLVAAFRATLEEILEADVIMHVRDIACPDTDAQKSDVIQVLKEIGVDISDTADDVDVLEVLNKADLLIAEQALEWQGRAGRDSHMVLISALTGVGIVDLIERLDSVIAKHDVVFDICVPYSDGQTLAWVKAHTAVQSQAETDTGYRVRFKCPAVAWHRYLKGTGKSF